MEIYMIDRFLKLLVDATELIPKVYFQLPVAEKEEPIYRERVYCYELYHQLRTLLEPEPGFSGYSLGGEINKQGHPIIRQCAPDFVLHAPGGMDDNLVVEVKPVNASLKGIQKDLKTLKYFLSEPVGYKLGVQLVYGDDQAAFSRFRDIYHRAGLQHVRLYRHQYHGKPATLVL
jgi:hypothetical protein